MKCPSHGNFTSISRHYRALLRSCTRHADLDTGEKLHSLSITTGLASDPNTYLTNTLFQFYCSFGKTLHAHHLFDKIPHSHRDIVDWTTLMNCYGRNGFPENTLNLFVEMQSAGLRFDGVTVMCMCNACAKLGNLALGAQMHCYIIKLGLIFGVKECNSIVDMYVKCRKMEEAKRVFEEVTERSVVSWTVILGGVIKWEGVRSGWLLFNEMPERNVVAWTVMIAGFVENGFIAQAFSLLSEMIFEWKFCLNHVSLCSILSGCVQSGDVMIGEWIHVYALKEKGNEINIMVATALIDMYAKSGRIDRAEQVFKKMCYRNVVAWNSMLNGLAVHGRGKDVLNIFPQMVKEAKPDVLTFMSVLSACSHAGLVDQGRYYFNRLESIYGIKPTIEHYACMVDLLGRAGFLEEANRLIREMPMLPNEFVLGSLLGSCHVHGKFQLGECLMRKLVEIDPQNTEYHILLSNMYTMAGKNEKANSLRQVLTKKGERKIPGVSSIHIHGQVYRFTSGDKSHPQSSEIYVMLKEMIQRLRLAGYIPNTTCQNFSAYDNGEANAAAEEEKEQALFSHSEKLAICFGLLKTKPGVPLYIFKNLRICQDCHSAVKIVSKIYNREITIRDRNRFHCFKQGLCSCGDYW